MRDRSRQRKMRLAWLLAGGLLTPVAGARAEPVSAEGPHGLVVGSLSCGWGGELRTGVPAHCGLSIANEGAADLVLDLEVSSPLPGRPGTTRRLELAAGAEKHVQLLVDTLGRVGDIQLTLSLEEEPVASRRAEVHWLHDEILVGVVGVSAGALAGLGDAHAGPVPGADDYALAPREVRVGVLAPADIPTTWVGFRSLHQLVWVDPDPGQLSVEQLAALEDWVAAGGRLVLCVGPSAWARVAASSLSELLPLGVTGSAEVDDLTGLASLLGLEARGVAGARVVLGRPAASRQARTSVLYTHPEAGPLLAAGRYGAGAVVQLLASPELAPLRSPGRAQLPLWRALLLLPATGMPFSDLWGGERVTPQAGRHVGLTPFVSTHMPFLVPRASSDDPLSYLDGDAVDVAARSQVGAPGAASPALLLPLLLALLAYALLLGPVEFLVARGRARASRTWLAFPVLVAVSSWLAWLLVADAKRGQVGLASYDLVDILSGADRWRGVSWTGLFQAEAGTVHLDVPVGAGYSLPLEPAGGDPLSPGTGGLSRPAWSASPAATQLSFEAPAWGTSLWRTAWVRSGGGVYLEPRGGRLFLRSELSSDLTDLQVLCGPAGRPATGEQLGRLERLPGGSEAELILRSGEAELPRAPIPPLAESRAFPQQKLGALRRAGGCTLLARLSPPLAVGGPAGAVSEAERQTWVRADLGPVPPLRSSTEPKGESP